MFLQTRVMFGVQNWMGRFPESAGGLGFEAPMHNLLL